MGFTLETVKELREKTHAGMMNCKKALQESNGDIEAAVEYLRKKGLATAAKKSGRIAADGIIADTVSSDGKTYALVEINCETDFVVKTDDFQKYAAGLVELVVDKRPSDIDALLELPFEGKTVGDFQTELVVKIGENIRVRRFETLTCGGTEKIATYMHLGSKIGALVLFEDPNNKLEDQLGKEIAMQVAAMHPMYVNKNAVPSDYIEKEKDIFKEQMANEKKPPEIIEKIIMGKLNKHFTEVCLEDQVFVKDSDGKTSVKNTLKKLDPDIKIKTFVRLQVGEGVEKKEANLAKEVQEMIK